MNKVSVSEAFCYYISMESHENISPEISENGSFLLLVPADLVNTPDWLNLKAEQDGFKVKPEYHVTVVDQDLASKIYDSGHIAIVQSLFSSSVWTL